MGIDYIISYLTDLRMHALSPLSSTITRSVPPSSIELSAVALHLRKRDGPILTCGASSDGHHDDA